MNELLMAVGIAVFFMTVYGAVMVGGHLLEELQPEDEETRLAAIPAERLPSSDRHVSPSEPQASQSSATVP